MPKNNKTLRINTVVKILVDIGPTQREHIYIEAKSFSNGGKPTSWAITNGNRCMSKKTGEFDYEPLPSSRDDDYTKEYRFNKLGFAESAYLKFYGDKTYFQKEFELQNIIKSGKLKNLHK